MLRRNGAPSNAVPTSGLEGPRTGTGYGSEQEGMEGNRAQAQK
jgi:hypothetical protein